SPPRPAASRRPRAGARRRPRTGAPRSRPARPARSAPRRSAPALARRGPARREGSLPPRDLALDPARVLLVLVGRRVELDDPLLPVEGVAPPDVDVRAGDLD